MRRPPLLWLLLSSLLLSSLLLVSPAQAAPQRLAVLTLQAEPPVGEAQVQRLREALRSALAGQGLAALPLAEVDRLLLATDLSCSDPACLERSARTLGVELFVGGRLSRGEDDSWAVALWLFDGGQRATLATVQEGCQACDFEAALQLAERAAAALWREAQQAGGRAELEVRSLPPGAEVSIDGSPMGLSGMTYGVAPGTHSVALRLPGYQLYVQEVSVAPAERKLLQVTLTPTPQVSSSPGGPSAARRQLAWLKWVLAGAAVATLATGAALWAYGRQEPTTAARVEKPELRDYTPAGIALTAAGAALAAGAGVAFWLDARAAPTAGGAGSSAALLFGYQGCF